jgi:hypothetical protein
LIMALLMKITILYESKENASSSSFLRHHIRTPAIVNHPGHHRRWHQSLAQEGDWAHTVADEFLKRLLVLIHMGSGQPLRESELFSVTWCRIVSHGRVKRE